MLAGECSDTVIFYEPPDVKNSNIIFVAPWCSDYNYCTSSFTKA